MSETYYIDAHKVANFRGLMYTCMRPSNVERWTLLLVYERYIKRAFDVITAAVLLLFSAIPFLLLALLIKLDSRGPVFFTQKRVGRDKCYFKIYKFRTMRVDAPAETPTHMLTESRRYITRVGRYLRISSLDELPQLINILKGDMSFVGPRPALWNQYDLIEARDRSGAHRVRPGLTGLAQIRGRDEIEIEDKAALDGVYSRNISLDYDLRIAFKTLYSVFNARGYQEGG